MLLLPSVARADEDEASLHVQLVGGLARIADDNATPEGTIATAPLAGLTARFGFATSDWFQWDAAATVAGTTAASFDAGHFEPPDVPAVDGPFTIAAHLARVDAGATARFGVRYIPTVRVGLGAQLRHMTAPVVTIAPGVDVEDARAASFGVDLVATGSIGFDYRVNRRTIVGIAVGGSYAIPLGGAGFQTLEASLMWSRYWYPRW